MSDKLSSNRFNHKIVTLLKEPFLHFIFLGLLIFAISSIVNSYRNINRYSIKVDKNEINKISVQWQKQYGTFPDKEHLDALIDNYIKEEIYYREGLDLNIGKDDEIVRRRIVQKFEFLKQDLDLTTDPEDRDIEDFYNKNKSKYIIPERITFTHIYFSPDKGGSNIVKANAEHVLTKLKQLGVNRAPELGDRCPYLYDYTELDKQEIAHQFGESELVETLFNSPEKRWIGPFQSGYGWHLVYINYKSPAHIEPLADIWDRVNTDYLADLRQQKNAEVFQKLKDKYSIKIEAASELNKNLVSAR